MKTWQHLREQICKIAAQVRRAAFGGRHGHLALVLNDAKYRTATAEDPTASTARLASLPHVHPNLTAITNQNKGAHFQFDQSQEAYIHISIDIMLLYWPFEMELKGIFLLDAKLITITSTHNKEFPHFSFWWKGICGLEHEQGLTGEVQLEHYWCINAQLVHRFGSDCWFS